MRACLEGYGKVSMFMVRDHSFISFFFHFGSLELDVNVLKDAMKSSGGDTDLSVDNSGHSFGPMLLLV